MIRTWPKNCTERHSTEAPVGHIILPDRIIDCGSLGDPAVHLRLHGDLSEEDQSSRYLTLSHCQGNAQMTKLTKADLSSFQAGIKALAFPKTFQDAVEATRQLGERDIWIDSLCIFQDSALGWRDQSSKWIKYAWMHTTTWQQLHHQTRPAGISTFEMRLPFDAYKSHASGNSGKV